MGAAEQSEGRMTDSSYCWKFRQVRDPRGIVWTLVGTALFAAIVMWVA